MVFRQITHDNLGCASCLVGDEKAGVAPSTRRSRSSTPGAAAWGRLGQPITDSEG